MTSQLIKKENTIKKILIFKIFIMDYLMKNSHH